MNQILRRMPQYKHPATHICVESYNLSLLLHKNEKEGPQESCYVGWGYCYTRRMITHQICGEFS